MARTYWLLGPYNNQAYGEIPQMNDALDWDLFKHGRYVESPAATLVANFERRTFERVSCDDWLPIMQPAPVVSRRFGKFLMTECPECVQLLPVCVSIDGLVINEDQFAILNVLCVSRAIDLCKSKFTSIVNNAGERVVMAFKSVVFLEDTRNCPEFFIEERCRSYTFCDDKLAKSIELGKYRVGLSAANDGLIG